MPGPGAYNLGTQFFDSENIQDHDKVFTNVGGKVYVDNNEDRFGRPILPRKPRELIPGPGEYNVQRAVEEPIFSKGGYITQAPIPDFSPATGVPGPAYYNPTEEPQKISFLFNAAEKWTN